MNDTTTAGLCPLDAVLAYVAQDFHVFRVVADAKRPYEARGHLDATDDPDEIRRRWTETPTANVGLALKPSGLLVLDLDGDPRGLYEDVTGIVGALPATLTHRTAGGGAHLIFRVPEGETDLSRKIRPWGPELPVDVLADGYAILPPSTVNGRAYVVHTLAPIAEAPPALVEVVRRGSPVIAATSAPLAKGEDVILNGTRDVRLFAIAAQFAEAGLRDDVLKEAMLEVNRRRCDPPCPDADVIEKARNAQRNVERYGKRERPEKIRTGALPVPPSRRGEGAAQPASGVRVVSTVPASSVKIETTRFVDPHSTVPVGALTVLAGDPGLGKTTWAMRLAARVSSAAPNYRSGAVIVVSAEDSPSTTLVPRLRAERADLDLAHFLKAETDGAPDGLRLPDDVDELRRVIEETGAVLVIVDPLNAHLGAEINGHRDQDIRRALAPLHRLCEDSGVSIVLVMHLNKSVGGSAIYRVGGSIGSMGAARSGVLMTAHPESDDEDEDTSALRVLSHVKCNVGPKGPGRVYRVEPVTLDADGHTVQTSRLAYVGVSDIDTDTLLDPPKPKRTSARDEAAQFLRDYLADRESHMSADVKQAAEDAGISARTLKRAAQDLVLIEEQTTEQGRQTVWKLRPFGRQGVGPKGVGPTESDQLGATPKSPQTRAQTAVSEGVGPTDPLLGALGATPLRNPFLLSSNGASSAAPNP